MNLEQWLSTKCTRNVWCDYTTKNGRLSVYVRRSLFDKEVVEIANVVNLNGFGSVRPLYRDVFKEIPAFAENILNPQLDKLLLDLGWTHAYYDEIDCPTRINAAFMSRYPAYADSRRAQEAMYRARRTVHSS